MTVFWCGVNAASAFVPYLLMPGLPAGTSVAWQAHVFGFLAGLLLIGPWLRLFHREYFTTN
jgi:membrane associated rhomboid family serine protease